MDRIKILFGDIKFLRIFICGLFIAAAGAILILRPQLGAAFFYFKEDKPVAIGAPAGPSAEPSAASAEEIKLLFLGDLMFDRSIRQAAAKNGNDFIFAKITDLLAGHDLVVANLEGPITDNRSVSISSLPGNPNNYIFTFDPSLAIALFNNNIRLVSLGNNHILNFNQAGLDATKQYLSGAGVEYFGEPAGPSSVLPNIKSVVKNIKGVKIAFVNFNQFIGNTASEQAATVEEIKKIKVRANVVIVYTHWGTEYDGEANSAIKNLAHEFIDAGADLVIGSHPHVIQNAEEYQSKKIYYSLGNFVFDQYFSETVRRGLAVILKINGTTKQFNFEEKQVYLQTDGQVALME